MNLKTGVLLGAYVLYRLAGGPKLIDWAAGKLANTARGLIADILPIDPRKPVTIKLNDTEFKII